MSKELILVRHGHAEDESLSRQDHPRKLTGQGRAEALRLAAYMLAEKVQPQTVYISTSTRTRETAALLEEQGALAGAALRYEDGLYLPHTGDLLHFIQHLPEAETSVMIVAHNPALYELSALLTADNFHDRLVSGMPTCAMIALRFDCEDWQDIAPEQGQMLHCFRP